MNKIFSIFLQHNTYALAAIILYLNIYKNMCSLNQIQITQ
jgi:hypothetical protein